jgi:hypothetical protein
MSLGRCVETRWFIGSTSRCWDVVDKAIKNKQYLIFNICTNRNDNSGHIPTDTEWKLMVDNTCRELLARGGNRLNSRITIINEPMKYISISRYAQLINLAYPIAHRYGFLMGAGNEQYTMAMSKGNMYSYILQNCQFDILDIHLQGDCEEDDKCRDIANVFKRWADTYNKPIDCTECFYSDIATSKGWNILKFQIGHAERIGCSNVCNVFNNLDRSQFPWNTSSWDKLCFNINGHQRSGYYGQYLDLVNSKAPIPNIKIPIGDDDMKLKLLKVGSKGNQVRWLQEILQEEYEFENEGGYDGIYGSKTLDQVKAYQTANGLVPDGVIGKLTTFDLITKAVNHFTPDYWMKKLQVYMAYE